MAFGAFVLGLTLFAPLVFGDIFASSLGETGILFETMEVNTSNVGLRGSVTPTTSFASGGTLKISFVDSSLGDWCKAATVSLTVTGIEVPLPGTLVGTCYQHSNGDYLEITGVGALTSGTTYGFEITKHANLSTGPDIGSNMVLLEVSSGSTAQSKLFSIYLMSNDKVQIVAEVSDAEVTAQLLPEIVKPVPSVVPKTSSDKVTIILSTVPSPLSSSVTIVEIVGSCVSPMKDIESFKASVSAATCIESKVNVIASVSSSVESV